MILRTSLCSCQLWRILFTRSGQAGDEPVDMDEEASRPVAGLIEGIAKVPGTYEHAAVVWQPQRPPVCTVAVLIIDP